MKREVLVEPGSQGGWDGGMERKTPEIMRARIPVLPCEMWKYVFQPENPSNPKGTDPSWKGI